MPVVSDNLFNMFALSTLSFTAQPFGTWSKVRVTFYVLLAVTKTQHFSFEKLIIMTAFVSDLRYIPVQTIRWKLKTKYEW